MSKKLNHLDAEKTNKIKFLNNLIKSKSDNGFVLKNSVIGKIIFPYGTFGDIRNIEHPKGAYGLEHIIQGRFEKNNLTIDQIVGTCLCIVETIKKGTIVKYEANRCVLEKNHISVVVTEVWDNKKLKWVLTGFPENEKRTNEIKKEAMDVISTANARYNYIPGYSDFRDQVGAITASICIIRNKLNEIKG